MASTLLRSATSVDGDVIDVRLAAGSICEVRADLPAVAGDRIVDLDGWVLLASAVEPHAHLDKAFLAERIDNPTGDLMGAIIAMTANRDSLDVPDTITRAERAARQMARNGFTAVRTHADTTSDHGLRSVEALVEVRAMVRDVIDVEIVALCGWPVTGHAGAAHRSLLRDALAAGADLVGGCPHLEEGDATAATHELLSIAAEAGRGVDLHTDETLDARAHGLEDLAKAVLGGFDHPVTASHCVSLGQHPLARQLEIAEQVAAAGISVVALPHTNLYLQGRGVAPVPRGLTGIAALETAGVTVAAGADNLQDPFNPLGRACPFETAALMVLAAHDLPTTAWGRVTTAARTALGQAPVALEPGSPADLLAVRAASLREALAVAPTDRRVWRHGVEQGETER